MLGIARPHEPAAFGAVLNLDPALHGWHSSSPVRLRGRSCRPSRRARRFSGGARSSTGSAYPAAPSRVKSWWAGRLIHSRDAGSDLAGLRRGTSECLSGLRLGLRETGTERGVSRERGSMPARKRSAGCVREPALPSRRDSALFHVYASALTQFPHGATVGVQGRLSDHPEVTNERSSHRRPPTGGRRSRGGEEILVVTLRSIPEPALLRRLPC